MSCRRIELLLPAAMDRRLEPAQLDDVDRHVSGCPSCAAELSAMQQTRATLAACGPAEPPAQLAARISQAVHHAVQQDAQPSFWERFIPVAWPAALAATLAAAVLLVMTLRTPPTGSTAPVVAPTTDPVEQVARSSADNEVQLASVVLGMEID